MSNGNLSFLPNLSHVFDAILKCWQLLCIFNLMGVRLKLAFCTTCAVRILVLAQGPSF